MKDINGVKIKELYAYHIKTAGCLSGVKPVRPHQIDGEFDEPRQMNHVREEFREFIDAYNDGRRNGWDEDREDHFLEEGIDLITVVLTELKAHIEDALDTPHCGDAIIRDGVDRVNEKNAKRHYFD